MPTLENLTAADVQQIVNSKSYSRARGYLNAIRNPVRSDNTLSAEVRGSRLYQVEIDVDEGGIHAVCSCPYTWGGYCKHIGGVLLKWLQAPTDFESRAASSPSQLHGLDVIPVAPPPAQRPDTQPDWLEFSFEDQCADDLQQMADWLNEYKLPILRGIAKKRNWRIKGARKDDVIGLLIGHLSNLGDNAKAIYSLDETHRNVLRATALLSGEKIPAADDLERVTTFFDPRYEPGTTETYTHHLVEAGLAINDEYQYNYPPSTDFVPRFLACYFPPLLETVIPTMSELSSGHRASEVHQANASPFLQSVHQLILLLEQSATPLRTPMPRPRLETFYSSLKAWDYDPEELLAVKKKLQMEPRDGTTLMVPPPSYLLPDDAIERLAPIAGDAARLDFMYALLVEIGVVQPGSPVTLWREVKETFLMRDDATQRAILARAYFHMSSWNELWAVLRTESALQFRRALSHDYFIFTPEDIALELTEFRHLVLRVLTHLPDQKWIVLDELRPLLRAVWPRFHQITSEPWYGPHFDEPDEPYYGNWFLVRQGVPLDPESESDWNLAQWNFICLMLTGPLHWLGLADVCYDKGSAVAVRFQGLADLYWDRVEAIPLPGRAGASSTTHALDAGVLPPAASESGPMTVEGDHIHVAPSAINVHAHNLLEKIAALETATADQFIYQLDVQSTHAAFESGVALADIVSDWSEHFQSPMPETIREQLTAWWEVYGQVRVYEDVTIFEFGDDYALAEMKAVTSLEKVLIAEISPRLVLIPPKSVATLMEELEKAGYTPKQA